MPRGKTWEEELPERNKYLYSGYRFLVKDTFYVLAVITYETAFLTSPFTIVYGIVDGTLTIVTDTLIAPFTYLADVNRQNEIDELPYLEVVPAEPFPVDDIEAKDDEGEIADNKKVSEDAAPRAKRVPANTKEKN